MSLCSPLPSSSAPERSPLTLDIQLGGILGEALQTDLLTQEVQELLEGRAGLLIVVHLLL